jgi:dCMP deaminase
MSRPNWDDFFMKLAFTTAERATCVRHHVGAIIVRDRHLLTGGYNGAPAGMRDCLELGCLRNELAIPSGTKTEVCRAVHAEENAVIQASIYAVSLRGGTIYCTHSPCRRCAKMLCNVGIERFVTCYDYDDSAFRDLFEAARIELVQLAVPDLVIGVLK